MRVPSSMTELRATLDGLDALITARKWERAAIVYAFTDVGGPRNTPSHRPPPPKMNIRTFAAQGFSGLTTPKAVSRYREAWITAINEGWAVPANPGDNVSLPDEPFPPWPYGEGTTWEDHSAGAIPPRKAVKGSWRPFGERVMGRLSDTVISLRQLAASDFTEEAMDDETRSNLADVLRQVRVQADEALKAIEGKLPV